MEGGEGRQQKDIPDMELEEEIDTNNAIRRKNNNISSMKLLLHEFETFSKKKYIRKRVYGEINVLQIFKRWLFQKRQNN